MAFHDGIRCDKNWTKTKLDLHILSLFYSFAVFFVDHNKSFYVQLSVVLLI